MTARASGTSKLTDFAKKKKCRLAPMNRPVLVPSALEPREPPLLVCHTAMPYCPCRHPRQIVQEAAVPSDSQPPFHGRDYSTATACSHLLASKCRVQRPMRSVRQRRLKRDNHLADNNLPAASLVSAPWRRGEGRGPCRLRVTRWNGMDGWMDAPPPLPLGRPSCGATATVPCEGSQIRNRSILTWTAKLV